MEQIEGIEKFEKDLEYLIDKLLDMYKHQEDYEIVDVMMEVYVFNYLKIVYRRSTYKPITIKDLSETIYKLYFNNPKYIDTETLNEEELLKYIKDIFDNENAKKIVIAITVEKRLLEIIKTIVFDGKYIYLLFTNEKRTIDINKINLKDD